MFSMQRKPELLRVFPSFQQAWYPWDSWWGLAWKNPHNPTLYYIILCHITIQTFTPHNPTHLYTHRVLVGVSCGLNGVNRLLRNSCRLQCTLSLEKAVQSGKFRFFQILCHIRIDVQRRRDIRMPQGILGDFDIYASLAHPCGKCFSNHKRSDIINSAPEHDKNQV